jgi:ribosomal protein S6E (S10)
VNRWAATLCLLAAACAGEEGTIQIEVVTAPGSDLLARIERARLTLSNPSEVVEAERGEDGHLSLSIDVVAEGQSGIARLEGFDAGGERIALGLTAGLPVAAVDAVMKIYLAPPFSFAEAPVALDPARSEAAGALLPYGAVIAGGRDAGGAPMADLVIYNVYDHSLQVGLDVPEARAQMTALTGPSSFVYLFGGLDATGEPAADAWRFDTTVAPAGLYVQLVSDSALARAGAAGAYAGSESFLVTGDPPVRLDAARAAAVADAVAMPAAGAAAATIASLALEPPVLVVGAGVGTSGAALFRGGAFAAVDGPPELQRSGHALLALPDGRLLAIGGADAEGAPLASGVVYDPAGGAFTVIDDLLATPRLGAAMAVTSDVVVIAGGTDAGGAPLTDAEIVDAAELRALGTLPLASPRVGGLALALPNRQVLLAGGTDGAGQPLALLELFTPRQ